MIITNSDTITASEILNNKVITTKEGKELGKVKDILYNFRFKKILALVLDEGGWFSGAEIIPSAETNYYGSDRVMVDSKASLVKLEHDTLDDINSSLVIENDEIKNMKLISEAGDKEGRIVDLKFDKVTGRIIEIKSSKGFFDKFKSESKWFPISEVISIGEDAIIISQNAARIIEAKNGEKIREAKKEVSHKLTQPKSQSKIK